MAVPTQNVGNADILPWFYCT